MRNENKKKLPKYEKLYYGHSSHISGNKRRPGRRSYFDGWLRMARKLLHVKSNQLSRETTSPGEALTKKAD